MLAVKVFRTLNAARREVPRILPLMRDARVPIGAKIATVLAALFVLSPLNILGDIPLLGFLDDAALLLFVAHTFVKYADGRLTAPFTPMKNATGTVDNAAYSRSRAADGGMLSR
ncbi:MAG: hypothetical protein NVS2B8_22020 [Vulcanimicrobiaceae bacterium]